MEYVESQFSAITRIVCKCNYICIYKGTDILILWMLISVSFVYILYGVYDQ